MDPGTAPAPAGASGAPRSVRRRWLPVDEGWSAADDVARLLASAGIALAAVGFKLLVVGILGGELGYLTYIGAVALGAWIAGLRGGLLATVICAVAQLLLFYGTSASSASPSAEFNIVLFLVDGAIVSLLSSRLRRAYTREHEARAAQTSDLHARAALYQTAERNRAALTRLQAVTASLAGAATEREVADAILDRGLAALGAIAGGVSRITHDGRAVETIAVRGYEDVDAGSRFSLETRSHLSDAIESGAPVFLPDPETWLARYPETPPHALRASPHGGAIAVLPLVVAGRVLGAVVFRFAGARDFDDATSDLAVRLAEQGALALDRALAYDAERRLRVALERGQARLAVLVRASDVLGSAEDVQAAMRAVPPMIVPGIADWCAIELLDADPPGVAVAGPDDAQAAIERLAALAPRGLAPWLDPDGPDGGAFLAAVDTTWAERLADPQAVEILDGLGTRSLVASPVTSPAGEPLGSILIGATDPGRFGADDLSLAQDLARRIAATTERSGLFATVTRFKATVDASADAVYMFDPSTLRLTYVNRGGANLVGRVPSELVGRSILELQPSVPESTFRARVRELGATDAHAATYTEVLAHAGGRRLPVDVFLQEVVLGDGTRAMILTARDISERIDVQARLARIAGDERRQAAELRGVIQAMGEGVLVVDPRGRISMANDAAGTIVGPDLAAGFADLERRLAALPAPPAGEDIDAPEADDPRQVQLDDGRWIEVAAYPVDLGTALPDRARASRIVVVRDVTRARDAQAAREAFLGMLSHELRTPVTTIYGYAKVLRRPNRREDQAEMLADIEVEADRLYRIVEDLLALSRVEGGISIQGEPVLVQHLVPPVVQSEAHRWGGVEYETRMPRDLPAVFGERTYVEQVLRNLLSNAGKYGLPGTTVTVEAEERPEDVVVRVLDRGIGIDPDEAERLFDLYYRSPGSARAAAGAGIGLYVGRGLIAAMGGEIWARPRPGGGSEFGFSLPRCREDFAEPVGAASR